MAHRYESIRELDEEKNDGKRLLEMSIEKYMEPRPFRKLGPWGEEEIEGTTIGYVCNEREACLSKRGKRWKAVPEMSIEKYMKPPPFWELGASIKDEEEEGYQSREANKSDRIRVKNIRNGLSFEFSAMVNSARFLGATRANMSYGIRDEVARMYRVGEEEFVFEYNGEERPMERYSSCPVLNGFAEVVWGSGLRERFDSYLSVAIHLGLLIGHIMEEEDRWRDKKLAKTYTIGKKYCTLEFNGERRQKDCGKGIVSHWKGLYVGDWEKVRKVMITQGNPQLV